MQAPDPADIESLVRETASSAPKKSLSPANWPNDGLKLGAASHYRFVLADRDSDVSRLCVLWPDSVYSQRLGPLLDCRVGGSQTTEAGAPTAGEASSRPYWPLAAPASTPIRHPGSSTMPTRAFYASLGYRAAGEFPDFYAPGDGKIVFSKALEPYLGQPGAAAPGSPGSAPGRSRRYP